MKRKSPETLLEFSDYIIPVQTKRRKLADDAAMEGWTDYYAGQLNDSFESCSPIPSPNSSVDDTVLESPVNSSVDDSFEMESIQTEAEPRRRKSKKRARVDEEFDIESIMEQDPLQEKPMNCRKPLRILIRAIKWIVETMKKHQKDVSDAVGVSASTFSLYMNNTPRQHGWRDLERRLIDHLRHLVRPQQYPNKRPGQGSIPLLTHEWPIEPLSPVYFRPIAQCVQISSQSYYAEEGYITPLALGYNYLLDLRM